ncbi:copper homeostasis protein [Bifidobacterium ramosum]|uniref:PF03932 family protein CutC n=1 Tax=Bifidobacterium ramosum TaxID=1798158 RepID=A0A6L4X3K4_9BIFI|nr:copper homeostasis protein CutC [Bifidobacterium ramosum]KAB8289093.1 copper homeostasis protein [Bifidobacterium ramosum]NEG70806.1 copper homeostasis protein CutC [Bifidobacterium ramosum]
MTVEIAVQDVEGARIALEEGADRIELCAALGATGGLTASYGMIQSCAHVGLPQGVQVLIRPRAGSFVFDDADKRVQIVDVRSSILAGASGVVVGGLNADGTIDVDFARQLVDEAHAEAQRCNRHVQITFHRAFDMVPDRHAALDTLVDLGFTRVLTSGGAPSVPEGLDALRDLVGYAAGRIQIEAGGGVRPDNIAAVRATGVDAVHLSAKTLVASAGGPGGGGDAPIERTDRGIVRAAVAAMR